MQVIVEPLSQGKAFYGYSKRVPSGNPAVPAVMGITWIRFRDQSELDRIRTHSAKIIQDFLDEPGFISIVTGAAGDRAFTVTAWENEEALQPRSRQVAFARQARLPHQRHLARCMDERLEAGSHQSHLDTLPSLQPAKRCDGQPPRVQELRGGAPGAASLLVTAWSV